MGNECTGRGRGHASRANLSTTETRNPPPVTRNPKLVTRYAPLATRNPYPASLQPIHALAGRREARHLLLPVLIELVVAPVSTMAEVGI